MNDNPELEGTPVGHFLFGLKSVIHLLIWTFEVGRHAPSVPILRPEDTRIESSA